MSRAADLVLRPPAPRSTLTSRRIQPRATMLGFGDAVATAAFAPIWMPSPLAVGGFSAAFLVPFGLAVWALSTPRVARPSLYGDRGNGLWIEMLCIGTALLLASLSVLVSPEPLRALRVILPMTYGVCALIVLTRVTPALARRLVYAMIIAGVVVTAAGLIMAHAGGTRSIVMLGYRFKGFFDNANQPALSIITIWPLLIALLLNARTRVARIACLAALTILAYALIRTGTKTGLAISFVSASLLYLYHAGRAGDLERAVFSLGVALLIIVVSLPLAMWILSWMNPIAFEKVNQILQGGMQDYQSIRSRNLIWQESIHLGIASPLLGEGAGSKVLGRSHSHNMIIDYFRGMGVFGMASAVLLLLAAATRSAVFYCSTIGNGRLDKSKDVVTLGLYLGGLGYLIGNQISDSFSPSTAFPFWMVYICAVLWAADRTVRPNWPRPRPARDWRPRTLLD